MNTILPSNQRTLFNGIEVVWFIGDHNRLVGAWEAWGKCNGRAYQLSAWYNESTREIYDISVNSDRKNYYYHKETFTMLTENKN